MQEMIAKQFELLATYEYFDKKYAIRLNTGNIKEFFKKLLDYENLLLSKQIENIDNNLKRKYVFQENDLIKIKLKELK